MQEEKLKVAQQVAIAHDLLTMGMFQGASAKDVSQCIQFLREFHQALLAELDSEKGEDNGEEESV